jgi:hypothetical protein
MLNCSRYCHGVHILDVHSFSASQSPTTSDAMLSRDHPTPPPIKLTLRQALSGGGTMMRWYHRETCRTVLGWD